MEELPDHTLRVQGLLEPRELVDEFTALLQNPRVVSANLLTPGDIQVLHVDGGDIVAITVPPPSGTAPVYIGGAWPAAPPPQRRRGLPLARAELNAMLGGCPTDSGPHPVAGGPRSPASSRIWLHSSAARRQVPRVRQRNACRGRQVS
ncbi:MAG: hypothetical protein ACLT5P_09310 [Flavonifractor plautii]